MRISRRGILIGTLAGGGLAVGYMLRPRSYPLPLEPGKGEIAFDAWIRIGSDGVITVSVPQLEMGQGITTLIPQIVAIELGADWRQIAVEPAPVSALYANLPLAARWSGMWMPAFPGLATAGSAVTRRWAEDARFMATADGTSLAAYEGPARAAAATTRALLCMAAADTWNVGWEECEAQGGFVVHGEKRKSFAELAAKATAFDPPDHPALRSVSAAENAATMPAGTLPAFPRLDLPSKVDGSHLFAGDVRLPDMVYAAIRHGPIGDSELADYDEAAAKGSPGLIRLIRNERWIAAVATDWWAAERALSAIRPNFTSRSRPDTSRIESALEEAIRFGSATRLHETGDPDDVLTGRFSLAVRYDAAPALHATLETATATARFKDGRLALWIASQAPESARRAAADALGIAIRDVILFPMPAGGSFDRRLEHDHAIEAAIIARETGRPVQLIWSRWQEHLAGWPRAPASAVMAAQMTEAGQVYAWKARIATQASAREFGQRLFGGKAPLAAMDATQDSFDPLAIEGAIPPYAVDHMAIEHVPVRTGLPASRLRGNPHGITAFFTESFIDELAHKAGREPLAFRMAMLGGDPRLAECLQKAAMLGNWNGGNDSSGQGLACHRIGEGRIAVIAISRRDETGVRVDRISAVADIGRIPNVDIARQQIEGGLIYGIGLALGSSTDYAEGLPINGRLGALDLPLLTDCPEIEVDFIDSDADPADPGELGVAVAAPAIANALFSATGLRFRRLPLLSVEL